MTDGILKRVVSVLISQTSKESPGMVYHRIQCFPLGYLECPTQLDLADV